MRIIVIQVMLSHISKYRKKTVDHAKKLVTEYIDSWLLIEEMAQSTRDREIEKRRGEFIIHF